MRNETWVIAEPRTVRTTIVANAADAAATGSADGSPDGSPTGDAFADHTPVSSVVVSLTAGSVRVEGHDRLDIELDVLAVSSRPLAATLSDDTFTLTYDFSGLEGVVGRVKGLADQDSAAVVLRVPRGAAVKVTTVRADVSVEDITAPVSVTTVDGAVETIAVTGAVTVSTAAGRVAVTAQTGSVSAKTGTGSIHLAGRMTRATASTLSGQVDIEPSAGASHVTAKTGTGRIAVRVPAGEGVDLEARSVTGAITLDGEDLREAGRSGVRTALVTRSDAGASIFLTASSVSGAVSVQHDA